MEGGDLERLQGEVEKYRQGYEQANDLCSQLMEMSQDLQVQLDEAKGALDAVRQEENERLMAERANSKKLHAQNLLELQEQARMDAAALSTSLSNQHQQELSEKDRQIDQLQGQLKRLFDHYAVESPQGPPSANLNEQASNGDELLVRLRAQVEELQQKYEAENKRAVDAEMKHRLLERIKNALKSSTDEARREADTKIRRLEQQLSQLQGASPPTVQLAPSSMTEPNGTRTAELEAQVAQLTREVAESKNESASLSQTVATLQLKCQQSADRDLTVSESQAALSSVRQELAQVEEALHTLQGQTEALRREGAASAAQSREKDTLIAELRMRIDQFSSLQALGGSESQSGEARVEIGVPRDQLFATPVPLGANPHVTELQQALQMHQSTISDLQQQCSGLRKEIVERNQAHERKIASLQEKAEAAEARAQEISQTQAAKLRSYEESYQEIESQLDRICQQMENLASMRESFVEQQEELSATQSQLALAQKEIEAKNELLYQEKKNLEVSKEISCDLQKHILDLSQTHSATKQQLEGLIADYEQLQLESAQHRNAFEQEKSSIVYDLLHKQMSAERSPSRPSLELVPESPYTPGTRGNGQGHREEKKNIATVKQKLIDELWRESFVMIQSPAAPSMPRPASLL